MSYQPENDVLENATESMERKGKTEITLPAGVRYQPKSPWQKSDCPHNEPGCQRKSTVELFVLKGDKKIPQGTKRSCENPACMKKAAEAVISSKKKKKN